jgi:transposase InsO family protein
MSHLTLADARRLAARNVSPRNPRSSRPRQLCISRMLVDMFVQYDDGTPVQPWVTVLMDMRTSNVLVADVSIEPGHDSVVRLLTQAMASHHGGAVKTLIADRDPEFHSPSFLEACRELGIRVIHSFNPFVESFWSELACQFSLADLLSTEAGDRDLVEY